jgi:hypothetical protein
VKSQVRNPLLRVLETGRTRNRGGIEIPDGLPTFWNGTPTLPDRLVFRQLQPIQAETV